MSRVEITTKIGCPLACTFCPQEKLGRESSKREIEKMMSIKTFKSILEILPPHVRIDFSGYSEPFSNPYCGTFIKLAALTQNPLAIYTTLQGCSVQDANILKHLALENRFNEFVIHLPDSHNNMRGFRLNQDYVYALELLAPLQAVQLMTMSANAQILPEVLAVIKNHPSFPEIRDKLPRYAFVGLNRAGSLDLSLISGQLHEKDCHHNGALTCKWTPFYDQNVILPDGTTTLCCMDYGLKHILGNILDGYYELFNNSAELKRITTGNMGGGYETICRNCSRAECHELNSITIGEELANDINLM